MVRLVDVEFTGVFFAASHTSRTIYPLTLYSSSSETCQQCLPTAGFVLRPARRRCTENVRLKSTKWRRETESARRHYGVCTYCSRSAVQVSPRPPSVSLRLNGVPRNSISSLVHPWSSPVATDVENASIFRRRPPARQCLRLSCEAVETSFNMWNATLERRQLMHDCAFSIILNGV